MKTRMWGAAVVAAFGITYAGSASADPASDKLDLVLKRLEAIEANNAKLTKENASLRDRLNRMDSKRGPVVTNASYSPAQQSGASPQPGADGAGKGGGAYAMANANAKAPAAGQRVPLYGILDSNGHYFLEKKEGNPLTFYTPGGEITGYGNIDVSLDDSSKNVGTLNLNGASPPVGNFGWLPAVSTNSSYLGVRGFQRLPNLGTTNFLYQFEVGFDVSATPGTKESNFSQSNTVNGAMFNRNTYIGFGSPEWGAIKVGKTDAPYKNSTAAFNPFAGEIGDYAVVMGNTGGDNRVEFGTRLNHAIWYESPSIHGFQLNALFAPGQNRSDNNDNIAAGDSDCAGGNNPQSTANNPVACIDGAYGNAASANLSYTQGPFYATVAGEWHNKVNRANDISSIYGLSPSPTALTPPGVGPLAPPAGITPLGAALFNADVADEWAFKVGALYHFASRTTVGGIFEMMRREVPAFLQFQNERSRNGTWLFATQELTDVDSVSIGWAHAFKANGDPGQHNSATLVLEPGATFAPNNNQADMVTANYKRKVSPNLTWYTAVAATFNGPSAHYDLGAGGRAVTTDCHDANGADGGFLSNPVCFTGTTIVGVSTGVQWRF